MIDAVLLRRWWNADRTVSALLHYLTTDPTIFYMTLTSYDGGAEDPQDGQHVIGFTAWYPKPEDADNAFNAFWSNWMDSSERPSNVLPTELPPSMDPATIDDKLGAITRLTRTEASDATFGDVELGSDDDLH